MKIPLRDSLLAADMSVVLLGEEVGPASDRVFPTPIAERGALGIAVGLALAGKRPFLEISSGSRLLPLLEELSAAAAFSRAGEFSAPVVVRVPVGGEAGSLLDPPVADLLASCGGIAIASPSSPEAAGGLLRAALSVKGPLVLLEPRAFATTNLGAALPLSARLLREGERATIAAWGSGVEAALHAADELAREGILVDVIDLVSLSPLDHPAIGARIRKTGRLVVADPTGFGERVLRIAGGDPFEFLEAPPSAVPAEVGALLSAVRAALSF